MGADNYYYRKASTGPERSCPDGDPGNAEGNDLSCLGRWRHAARGQALAGGGSA